MRPGGAGSMRKVFLVSAALATALALGAAGTHRLQAQQQAIKRAVLVKSEKLTGVPGMDGYVIDVTIAPGAQSGWHVHPGHEFSVVQEGEGMLEVAGQVPMPLKKGTGFHVDSMVPHNGVNTSTTAPLRVAVVYVVQSGKPIATPVPAPAK